MSKPRIDLEAARADSPDPRRRNAGRFFEWLLISAVGLTVLSLVAAHAPNRIRLLGLFGIAFGLLAGAGSGRLASFLKLKPTVFATLSTSLLIAAGGFGVIWESRRIYADDLLEQYNRKIVRGQSGIMNKPVTLSASSMKSATGPMPEVLRRKWEEETRLTTYLAWRISNSPLSGLSVHWAVAMAIAEWVFGSLAGAWMFVRTISHGRAASETVVSSD